MEVYKINLYICIVKQLKQNKMETIRLQNEAFFTFNKCFKALTISGELTGDFILCGVASGNFQTVMCTDTNEMFLIER